MNSYVEQQGQIELITNEVNSLMAETDSLIAALSGAAELVCIASWDISLHFAECRGPFYSHGLTLIPEWTSNYTHYKTWDEITYPFPNFNGCAVEVGEWIILSHTILGTWLLIHAGIEVNPC